MSVVLDPLFLQPYLSPDETAYRLDDEVKLFTHDPPSEPRSAESACGGKFSHFIVR